MLQQRRQGPRRRAGTSPVVTDQDGSREQQGRPLGPARHQHQTQALRAVAGVQPAPQSGEQPGHPVAAMQTAQPLPVQRTGRLAQPQQQHAAHVQEGHGLAPRIAPVAILNVFRQRCRRIQQLQAGKDNLRPVVVIAPEDMHVLIDVPPVADIGAGRSGQPSAGAQDSPLLSQETALRGRHMLQQGFHRRRGCVLPHPQHGEGRRAKKERVRLEVPGEGGRGRGGEQHVASSATGDREAGDALSRQKRDSLSEAAAQGAAAPISFLFRQPAILFQGYGCMLANKNSILWQESVLFCHIQQGLPSFCNKPLTITSWKAIFSHMY